MADVVLDSSVALAAIFDEPGAAVARQALPGGLMSAVNHAEVLTKLIDQGMTPSEARYVTARFDYEVAAADSATAETIARFHERTGHRDVSLGDQFCLALGIETGLPVLTGDRRWADLGLELDIRLIR